MGYLPVDTIRKRKNGTPHTEDEISWFIKSYMKDEIPDYQMSAWLMAANFNPLTIDETFFLTREMKNSGEYLKFDSGVPTIDKHSTGGVGDKASLILGPMAAACGLQVPMITGRGLGHTGGTTDKLESIPGYNTALNLKDFKNIVEKNGISIIGQTESLCPADRRIYGLRDVTATVESIPLICASILSKKWAEGIEGLVMDVKCGSGAFMKSEKDAENLCKNLIEIGARCGLKVVALLTNMDQPLGRCVGNALEIKETLEVLGGDKETYADTRELSIELTAHMLCLSDKSKTVEDCREKARDSLDSGKALQVFQSLVELHGGDLSKLPEAKTKTPLLAKEKGYITAIDTYEVGMAGVLIGAGRKNKSDQLDLNSGFYFHKKLGDHVQKGEPLLTIHCDDGEKLKNSMDRLYSAIEIEHKKINLKPLVQSVFGVSQ